MYKLATLTAVTAAASIEEFKQTADLFKITLQQQEVMGLEKHAQALEREEQKYQMQMQNSGHAQQFEAEAKALVQTKEFMALAKYIEAMKKKGPTPQMQKFAELYKAQMQKVQIAHMKLQQYTQQNVKMTGQEPNQTATVDVDNKLWFEFNKEYYKLREMEYYAMYKIPEVAQFRAMVTDVRKTPQMSAMTGHWKNVTQAEQHQIVVKHQAELVMAAVKCLHMTKEDEMWMSPKKSPVMFEAWHAIYLYFVAVGKGDLEPMLDFMIDGKYDEKFANAVKPDFGAPKELYLY